MSVFRVEVSMATVMMVQADDRSHAFEIALDGYREAFAEDRPAPDIDVCGEVKNLSQLRDGWDGMAVAYGGDGNTRLKDILPE